MGREITGVKMKTLAQKQSERRLRGLEAEYEVAKMLAMNGYPVLDREWERIDLRVAHPDTDTNDYKVEVKEAIYGEKVNGMRTGRFWFKRGDLNPYIDCFIMVRMDGKPHYIMRGAECVQGKLEEVKTNKLLPGTVEDLKCLCELSVKTPEEIFTMSDSNFDKWRQSQVNKGLEPITKKDWKKKK